jgi:hypothetical protein
LGIAVEAGTSLPHILTPGKWREVLSFTISTDHFKHTPEQGSKTNAEANLAERLSAGKMKRMGRSHRFSVFFASNFLPKELNSLYQPKKGQALFFQQITLFRVSI